MFADGKYDTTSFCTMFLNLYFFENDGRSLFCKDEKKILDDFSAVVERFTNIREDLLKYPDTYCDERQVLKAFELIKIAFDL